MNNYEEFDMYPPEFDEVMVHEYRTEVEKVMVEKDGVPVAHENSVHTSTVQPSTEKGKDNNDRTNVQEQTENTSNTKDIEEEVVGDIVEEHSDMLVHRNSNGDIVRIETFYGMGQTNTIRRHHDIADAFAEYNEAAYNGYDMFIRPENAPFWISEKNMIEREMGNVVGRMKGRDIDEMLRQLTISADRIVVPSEKVQLRNGYYLDDGELKEGVVEEMTPWYLDVEYDPDAYSPAVDEFLDRISYGDSDTRRLFEEMIGHILLRSEKDGRIFFLVDTVGDGETGKSTLGDMLRYFVNPKPIKDRKILPPKMVSNVMLHKFVDDTIIAKTASRMLNYGDETKMDYIPDTHTIKLMATQGVVEVRQVYARGMTEVQSSSTFVFSTNGMPEFSDKSGGFARRLCIIPFDRKINATGVKADLTFGRKLRTEEAQSYILNLGLKGIQSMKANDRRIHLPDRVRKANEQFMKNNDNVAQFIETKTLGEQTSSINTDFINDQVHTKTVYEDYKEWCQDVGASPIKKSNFDARMHANGFKIDKATKPVKKFDGGHGRVQVYVKVGSSGDGQYKLLESFLKEYDVEGRHPLDVHEDYVKYAEENNVLAIDNKALETIILERGYEKRKSGTIITYNGDKEGRPMVYHSKNGPNPFINN